MFKLSLIDFRCTLVTGEGRGVQQRGLAWTSFAGTNDTGVVLAFASRGWRSQVAASTKKAGTLSLKSSSSVCNFDALSCAFFNF